MKVICLGHLLRGCLTISIIRLGWSESSDQNYSIFSPGSKNMAVCVNQGGTGGLGSHHSECVLLVNLPVCSRVPLPSEVSVLSLGSFWYSPSRESGWRLKGEGTTRQTISRSCIGFSCIPTFRGTSCCQFLSLCEVLQGKSGCFWACPTVNLNFSFMGLLSQLPLNHLLSIFQNVVVVVFFLILFVLMG